VSWLPLLLLLLRLVLFMVLFDARVGSRPLSPPSLLSLSHYCHRRSFPWLRHPPSSCPHSQTADCPARRRRQSRRRRDKERRAHGETAVVCDIVHAWCMHRTHAVVVVVAAAAVVVVAVVVAYAVATLCSVHCSACAATATIIPWVSSPLPHCRRGLQEAGPDAV
jgi:hypothetical protein